MDGRQLAGWGRDVLNGRRRWGPTRSNFGIAARPRFRTKRLPTRRRPHIAASVGRGQSGWKRLGALASSRRFPYLHSAYREASRRSEAGRTAVARGETLSSDRTPEIFFADVDRLGGHVLNQLCI
jgi:hypothetical protein